jgi:hypothetical protein
MIDLLNLLWGALTGQFRCRVSLEAQSWFFAISLTCCAASSALARASSPAQQQGFCDIFNSLN